MAERNIADFARAYVRAGYAVNPVYVTIKDNGKKDVRPVGLWRVTSSRSLADVESWWGEHGSHQDSQILIDCGKSDIVVIDCDGSDGTLNYSSLIAANGGRVGETTSVCTPGGGMHVFYRAHPDHVIGNDQNGRVAASVDVRGLGGFVIAPPSTDARGTYVFLRDLLAVEDLPVVPDVVCERMRGRTATTSATAPPATECTDDLFTEDAERTFTDEQARAFVDAARTRLAHTSHGFNGAINDFAMTCAHFPWLIDQNACAQVMIEVLGPVTGWTHADEDDLKTIASAYRATAAGRSWTATRVKQVKPAESDSAGLELPPPTQPYEVAQKLVELLPHTGGELHLTWWRGDFYQWTGAHWEVRQLPSLEQWIYQTTASATYQHPVTSKGEVTFEERSWSPNRRKIGDVTHALGVGVLQRGGDEDHALAATNGVVDIRTREVSTHRPSRFNLFSLPFAYDPAATCPQWYQFLDQVLPGDDDAQRFLSEWFGYVLSGRTDLHKMAALIGKRRCGKGTIARVLRAMIGERNAVGLDLNLIGGTFGLEPLIGKALAVSGDVRWQSRSIGDAVPVLLGLVGEDAPTVHRKNRPAWEGHLGARVMLMSNETPTFTDRSGALSGRMVFLKFNQTFYGREDSHLTEKLLQELPGVLNWALEGLSTLTVRGRFSDPLSGLEEAETAARLSDPIQAFLDDWCDVGSKHSIELDHLFLKYQAWCSGEGRTKDTTTKEIFSRDLRAKIDDLEVRRISKGGRRARFLYGVGCSVV